MHRRQRMKYLLCTVLLMAALPAPAADSMLQEFTGNTAQIAEYAGKGKWLAVMYWASDCHVCNIEAPNYADFHQRHSNIDAAMLGISLDGAAGKVAAEQFIKRHKIGFPNLIGEADVVALQYASLVGDMRFGTPSFLLYDPQGELVASQLGAVPVASIEKFIEAHSQPR